MGFFFSSRRRHTRWPRDWSSDVCSSDLIGDRIGIGDLHAVALLGHDLDDLALVIDLLDAVLGLDGVLLGTGGDPLAHTLLIDRDGQGLAALVRAARQPAAAALGRQARTRVV